MNTIMIVKATKFVVNTCVNRTVVDAMDNVTRNYGDTRVRKVIKFIGREGLGLVITAATKDVIDKAIDDAAEKISDVIVEYKERKK